ncbi:MAG: nuclear transport factor 2 family protein [Gammaproteobacteria bacterium]|nr:nuclear transport factor 2 family protein [Gammaproteobacteria bacterium]
MNLADLFKNYADDFELTFVDDNWSRLEQYFTENAIYETEGALASVHTGRDQVFTALRENISRFDRRCDSRNLETIEGPQIEGDTLTRRWRCTFTLRGAPDLSIVGDERAHYERDRICRLEEMLTEDSQITLGEWIGKYQSKLAG